MKAQLPIIHHGSGHAGNIIFQTYWGRTFLRSMPVLFHYPDTPAQQKAQGLYWTITRQFQAIYGIFKRSFPKRNNSNRNIYSVLSKGIFQAADPYDSQHTTPPPLRFGLDTQQQIKLSFLVSKVVVEKTTISIAFQLSVSLWRRAFRPTRVYLVAVNRTQQSLLGAEQSYQSTEIEFVLQNSVLWESTDAVVAYVAIGNKETLSNFYLIK